MAATTDPEQSPRAQYTTLQANTIIGRNTYMLPDNGDREYMYPMIQGGRQTNEQLSAIADSSGGGKQQTEKKSKKSYLLCGFLIISILFNVMSISSIIVFVAIMEQPSVADSNTALSESSTVQLEISSLQNYLTSIETIAGNITSSMETIAGSLAQFSKQNLDDLLSCVSNNTESPLEEIVGTSCEDIRSQYPNSPSGYYTINNEAVYCEMGELCGSEGGWTRLAYLDMNNASMNCPEGFELYEDGDANDIRACGRLGDSACSSVQFPSNGVRYSEVCGRVVGYQFGSTDGLDASVLPPSIRNNIDYQYVDGVSITRGNPRQHIWTLMAGFLESIGEVSNSFCPCNSNYNTSQRIPSFIGNDYFCESGNRFTSWKPARLYTDDPLWDGEMCGSAETNCCTAPGLPWFNKTLNTTTTDYLELRVCGDHNIADEDAPVSFYEIYVK